MMMTQIFLCQKNKPTHTINNNSWLSVCECCLWLYKIKKKTAKWERGERTARTVWYVCHDQTPAMTFMTIAAKSASISPSLSLSPHTVCMHLLLTLISSHWAVIFFFSFSLLYFTLFSLRFHFLVVCQSLLISGLALRRGMRLGVLGGGCQKPTSCFTIPRTQRQRHNFRIFFSFVKFTSAIPEIMSNIPRAMPKKKKKKSPKKITEYAASWIQIYKKSTRRISRNRWQRRGRGVGVCERLHMAREQIINRQTERQRIVIFWQRKQSEKGRSKK